MGTTARTGRVIWHDLMTPDVAGATEFYAQLLGWNYQVEHASDFAWRPGEEADYPLILVDRQAHGGFVEIGRKDSPHWLAWVDVEHLDEVVARAELLGATLQREPFTVPGVGRGAVIRDPMGAAICPFVPSYELPRPRGVFVWDELLTGTSDLASSFYGELFGWRRATLGAESDGALIRYADEGHHAGGVAMHRLDTRGSSSWLTYLATDDVARTMEKALELGATVQMGESRRPPMGWSAVLADPTGALFGLVAPGDTGARGTETSP